MLRLLAILVLALAIPLGTGAVSAAQGSSFSITRTLYAGPTDTLSADSSDATYLLLGTRSSVRYHVEKGNQWWDLSLTAPTGQTLAPGTYETTSLWPTDTMAGFMVTGNSQDCGIVSATITINAITFDDSGAPLSLDASFDKHCIAGDGSGEAHQELQGTLRFIEDEPYSTRAPQVANIPTTPIAPTSPSILRVTSQVGAPGGGRSEELSSLTNRFTLTGDARLARFSVAASGIGWSLTFGAPRYEVLHTGQYADTYPVGWAMGRSPTLEVDGDMSCSGQDDTGSFTVNRIETGTDEAVTLLDVSFVLHCMGPSGPAVTGELCWNCVPSGSFSPAKGEGAVFMSMTGSGSLDTAETYTSPSAGIWLSGGPRFVRVLVRQTSTTPGKADGSWDIVLSAGAGQKLEPGSYTVTESDGRVWYEGSLNGDPALYVEGNGSTCNTQTGSFTVHSVTFDANGLVTSLDADVTERCNEKSTQNPARVFSGTIAYRLHPVSAALTVSTRVAARSSLPYTVKAPPRTVLDVQLQGQTGTRLVFRSHVHGRTDRHGQYRGAIRLAYRQAGTSTMQVISLVRTARGASLRTFRVALAHTARRA